MQKMADGNQKKEEMTGSVGKKGGEIFDFTLYKPDKPCYNNLAVKQMHRWLNG